MKRSFRLFPLGALVLTGVLIAALGPGGASDSRASGPVANLVLQNAVDVYLGRAAPTRPFSVSSGPLLTALEASGARPKAFSRPEGNPGRRPNVVPDTLGCQRILKAGEGRPDNVRVNQECSLRRQAEETIAVNPTNPNNLIAGQNDSRIGFNHCGYDYSFDGGRTWGDMVPPFWQFVLEGGHTSDACSDPTVTFDSKGNAYVGGVFFDINTPASAFLVMKSNAPIGGAFYHNPGEDPFQEFLTANPGVIANDNDPNIFHDKEFIVADSFKGSPKADNVYGTWTRFEGAESPIYFSQSTDGGATFSPGVEISGAGAVCGGGRCNQDQGSHPTVKPDGTVVVTFGNANTPGFADQILVVQCPPNRDCSQQASWTAPVKVNDLVAGHPGGTLPPNTYRVPIFTSISNSTDADGNMYVVWEDFRNGQTPCPPCDMDIFYSVSRDGGATWSSETNLTPKMEFGATAQWQPWSQVTPDGESLWVAYYDRQYGRCERTGCNDITAVKINDPAGRGLPLRYTRVTTDSMPNLTAENNPVQAGFLGDYMWVATDKRNRAHIVWADTRGLRGTVEEDIYYAQMR
jgi:hypothetical protein